MFKAKVIQMYLRKLRHGIFVGVVVSHFRRRRKCRNDTSQQDFKIQTVLWQCYGWGWQQPDTHKCVWGIPEIYLNSFKYIFVSVNVMVCVEFTRWWLVNYVQLPQCSSWLGWTLDFSGLCKETLMLWRSTPDTWTYATITVPAHCTMPHPRDIFAPLDLLWWWPDNKV